MKSENRLGPQGVFRRRSIDWFPYEWYIGLSRLTLPLPIPGEEQKLS